MEYDITAWDFRDHAAACLYALGAQPAGRMRASFHPSLPPYTDDSDVELVIDSVDDLFLHAGYTEEQELDARKVFAAARARLWEEPCSSK
jgi:hypothetical protein